MLENTIASVVQQTTVGDSGFQVSSVYGDQIQVKKTEQINNYPPPPGILYIPKQKYKKTKKNGFFLLWFVLFDLRVKKPKFEYQNYETST